MNTNKTVDNFIFPFSLSIEPLKKIIVIDYQNDKEYKTIEPQYYEDSDGRKGLRILMYRHDKKVDVYWERDVVFDPDNFTLEDGIGNASVVKMISSKFEISPEYGVDMDIRFNDISGRRVELKIKESNGSNKCFPFLAPVGKDIKNPNKLFFAYMQEFDFVKQKGAIFYTKIEDRVLVPANFPIMRNFRKVYFARYSTKLTIGEINKYGFSPLVKQLHSGTNKCGSFNIDLNDQNKITSYWIDYNNEKVKMILKDGFPNISDLRNNTATEGIWEYRISDDTISGGNYILNRKDHLVAIEFNITKNWKPKKLPFGFIIFTSIVRSFLTWPTTYKWRGELNLEDLSLTGKWFRV